MKNYSVIRSLTKNNEYLKHSLVINVTFYYTLAGVPFSATTCKLSNTRKKTIFRSLILYILVGKGNFKIRVKKIKKDMKSNNFSLKQLSLVRKAYFKFRLDLSLTSL